MADFLGTSLALSRELPWICVGISLWFGESQPAKRARRSLGTALQPSVSCNSREPSIKLKRDLDLLIRRMALSRGCLTDATLEERFLLSAIFD